MLIRLFHVLVDNHTQLNLKKCSILKTSIVFLGYEVTFNQIRSCNYHVENVENFPIPTSEKALQRFLGLMSYFRKFIYRYNHIANPLYELMNRHEKSFKFESEHYEAFEKPKGALISKPVLSIYSPALETQLHTDAPASGFGGILMQRQVNDNQFHPVMFYSRKTTATESVLHSFELETLAIVYSVKQFLVYLFGIRFKIVTDCNSLKATLSK